MTQDERKVIELALEALQMLHDENMDYLTRNKLGGENNQCMVFARETITAIKEALAQPEQEPVAWMYPEGLEALKAGKPWTAYGTRQEPNNTALYLSPQPDIPPYAWVTFTPYGDEDDVWYENPEGQLLEGWTYKPLYDTTPPQHTWVGLTDEDDIDWEDGGNLKDLVKAIEVKLKEKNTRGQA